ncbi:MAG: ATP-binding protein [Candidatus Abyssubacteria bacterium]
MNLKPRNLRKQLLSYLFASAVIVFLLTELIFIEKNRRSLVKISDKNAEAYALNLVAMTRDELGGTTKLNSLDEIMREFGDRHTQAYFLIIRTSDNKELERSESLQNTNLSLPAALRRLPHGRTHFWTTRINGGPVRFVALREFARPDADEECLFIVGFSQRYLWKRLQETIEVTAPILGIGLIAMLLLSWIVVHRGLTPIRKLEQEVRYISSSNLTPVTIPQTKEFVGVATTLNTIIAELKKSFERERRFTANVAHELRTRISEMRALCEVALKYGDNLDEHNRSNYEEILVSAKEMQATVMNLLTLARCHSGQLKPRRDIVELQPLVNSIWTKLAEQASAKKITFQSDIPADLSIVTDKELLETILQNLFSNAVSYVTEHGLIEWRARIQIDRFSFSISNTVENLSDSDLQYLFEPFWRKDKVRSSGDAHSGLGLALVQSLAEVLGFTVNARLTTPTLLTITLSGKTSQAL